MMRSIVNQGAGADMAMTRPLTSADLERMGDDAERYELIAGVLRETKPIGGRPLLSPNVPGRVVQ